MKPPVEGYLESGDASTAVGVVLAGGRSLRMGRDKATLNLEGERWVDHAVRRMAEVVPEVLVADRGRHLVEDRQSVEDGPGAGPAAGILGAANAAPGRSLLVLACDLPNLSPDLLRHLLQSKGDWVVARSGGRFQTLASLYRPRALVQLRHRVDRGAFGLQGLAEDLRADPEFSLTVIDERSLAAWGDPETLFANWNQPEDLPLHRTSS